MFKRISLILVVILVMGFVILSGIDRKHTVASNSFVSRKTTRVAVLLMNFTDDYICSVRKNLEDIQKENPTEVEFTFHDGKSNQAIQDEQLDKVLKEGVDLVLLHLIDNTNETTIQTVINKFKQTNTPVILFNREPTTMKPIKAYKDKALYIGLDAKKDGIMQGEIIVDEWNNNRASIDKNNNDILEYVMLKGEYNNIVSIERSKYPILTIEQSGIKTKELISVFARWEREAARNAMESILLRYNPNNIDVIITNDDSMALGAIQALQAQGFNTGNKEKTVAVVGVEGLVETQELIKKGMMLGTILQDPKEMAQALYTIGMNLVQGVYPLEDTPYEFDETQVSIRIPNKIYKP